MSTTNQNPQPDGADSNLAERVRTNQQKLASELKPNYDFIVCGSGSSGSVVARRLAENLSLHVLLLEAGGHDELPSITFVGLPPTSNAPKYFRDPSGSVYPPITKSCSC